MGATVPGMTEIGADWRVLDGVATAWFDAPSLIEGAALAGRIVELSAGIVVDLRATGMRVRLDSDEHAEAVSAAARDLGLAANPAVLQPVSVVFESAHPRGEAVLAARARLRAWGGRRFGGSVAARPCDTDPAVDRATAVAKPHPPRRGAAGRGGRAGESWGRHRDRSGSVTPTPTATRSTWCRARRSARGSG